MRTFLLLSLLLFLPYAHTQKMDELRKRLHAYVDTLDATVGVAVITAEDDSLTVNNDIRYPMMSVFKFHQALALSDYMAGKHLPLETRIRIKPEDLRLKETWSPLRDKYPNGGIELTVADLMTYTMEQSDNLACDILFDRFMSPKAVNAFIKKQGRIDPSLPYPYRIRPLPADLIRIDEKVSPMAHIGSRHIKPPFIFTDRRRPYPFRRIFVFQIDLRSSRQHMTDLLPMNKVSAVKQRYPREKLKRAVYEIIIVSHSAYAGIRIESR